MAKIIRDAYLSAIKEGFRAQKVVTLIGPRQVGKSTLARDLAMDLSKKKLGKTQSIHFFDLEDPNDEKLLQNPKLTLGPLEGLIIIDEIQRRSELFPYLRAKADSLKSKSRILLLGSSSRDLIEKASESLAGRIKYIEIFGFSNQEVTNLDRLFFRGGMPPSYLGKTDALSLEWRNNYIRSFIERDIRNMGVDLPAASFRRFMEMLVFYHGQIFNSSEIGSSLGITHPTVRKYFDILAGTFLVRELRPWHESILKRQVKMSKIYLRDSGLAISLMGIKSRQELSKNPKIGSLWEGFAMEELIRQKKMENEDLYFWSVHQGVELDLFWKNKKSRIGFELKYSDAPSVTKSMQQSIEYLKLDRLYVIYPGNKRTFLTDKIELVPLELIKETRYL